MDILLAILNFLLPILFAAGAAILFIFLNMKFLHDYWINKWIPLCIGIGGFLLAFLLRGIIINSVVTSIQIFFIIFFGMWFLDRRGYRKKEVKKEFVIKSKAKPNRVKK